MATIAILLRDATTRLAEAGVEEPRREARLLLQAATGVDATAQVAEPEAEPAPELADRFEEMVAARVRRVPMAYLRGEAPFFELAFVVEPGILIPRPETELLVELSLREFPDEQAELRLLDMGTGSGCLLVSLLHARPNAAGWGSDISPTALAVTLRNAARHGVDDRLHLVEGSWGAGIDGPFDLILSNPPYIATGEMARLQPEVALHEPVTALDGGPDGLDAYRALTPDLDRLLTASGTAYLEIGHDQAAMLELWFSASGYSVKVHQDLAGLDRCLELRRLAAVPSVQLTEAEAVLDEPPTATAEGDGEHGRARQLLLE